MSKLANEQITRSQLSTQLIFHRHFYDIHRVE
jgi:hypothetical protein